MTEYIAPEVSGDADECKARGPAGDPPEKIIGRDERHEESECQPYATRVRRARRQTVDQILDAVLRAYRTSNRGNDGRQYDDVRCETLAQVAQHEGKGTVRISRKIVHDVCKPVEGEREFLTRHPAHDYVNE